MTTFSTKVTLKESDVKTLKSQGYSLYAFKAVEASSGGGAPTVWFRLNPENLATSNMITWTEEFQGYNSTTQIGPNVTIVSSNTIPTQLGNLITINDAGTLSDSKNGVQGSVAFLNKNAMQYTVGINQVVGGESRSLCAFPILGSGASRVITPKSKIALIFSTERIMTSTVITRAMSGGALIDLTGVNNREVSFGVKAGWTAPNDPSWLNRFNAFESLSALLISSPESKESVFAKSLMV
ncbi:MAG: hypothetical protein Roseis2KO_03490 [Roseivirga sp.]